ncbi:hypothetical protein [Gordonia sp. C13]|uniref:hypothetical protein n=1 Tax=Gordonia sp. C13 TaxID=2935078 RepID=UPI00200B46C3|nr:hypothetical protein [Gordonia sp. C13]MCK8613499.1 hypothetical protein [Gordonia sp. C13]
MTVRCVGTAPRTGFAAASPTTAGTTCFPTSDADSAVPPDWLLTHVDAADSGPTVSWGSSLPTDSTDDARPRADGRRAPDRFDEYPQSGDDVHAALAGTPMVASTSYSDTDFRLDVLHLSPERSVAQREGLIDSSRLYDPA